MVPQTQVAICDVSQTVDSRGRLTMGLRPLRLGVRHARLEIRDLISRLIWRTQMLWTSFGSRASYRTCHSATPERSFHLLVESARKVGVQMDLHLLLQPLGWHSRQLGSPWPVLIDQGQLGHPHW